VSKVRVTNPGGAIGVYPLESESLARLILEINGGGYSDYSTSQAIAANHKLRSTGAYSKKGWRFVLLPDEPRQDRVTPDAPPATLAEALEEKFDVVGFINDFETGALDDEQVAEGFQHLIDSGIAWALQGAYGRTAAALIDAGVCQPANRNQQEN
jgi:hypothetical protein